MVWVASQDGLTHKNMGRVTVQPIFASSKKKSSSGRVFLDQVSSIQKILTRFAMPSLSLSLSLSPTCHCSIQIFNGCQSD